MRRKESIPMNDRRPMGNTNTVLVIGGGAAGMMAAITAAQHGASVTVFEPNRMLGRKLRITGKGRCNVTNDCAPAEVLENVRKTPGSSPEPCTAAHRRM